jgi:hypothetical protein
VPLPVTRATFEYDIEITLYFDTQHNTRTIETQQTMTSIHYHIVHLPEHVYHTVSMIHLTAPWAFSLKNPSTRFTRSQRRGLLPQPTARASSAANGEGFFRSQRRGFHPQPTARVSSAANGEGFTRSQRRGILSILNSNSYLRLASPTATWVTF